MGDKTNEKILEIEYQEWYKEKIIENWIKEIEKQKTFIKAIDFSKLSFDPLNPDCYIDYEMESEP